MRMADACPASPCSFGGESPERRAARSLQTFFTFVAARIVQSQLEGIGRGDLGSYNADAMRTLLHYLQNEPMRDSADWLARLMKEDELLGGLFNCFSCLRNT
jgi:hypothetical protein